MRGTDVKGCILPIKSVGVQGDARSYKNLALLSFKGLDFNWGNITDIAKKLTDSILTINRVGYILNKNSVNGNIKCYDMRITDYNIDLLRELDYIVTSNLSDTSVNQAFAVLLPIGINKKYSVAIRTFVTSDFMTGRPGRIGKDVKKSKIKKIVREIEEKYGDVIEFIIYDVTSKPPATTEWQ